MHHNIVGQTNHRTPNQVTVHLEVNIFLKQLKKPRCKNKNMLRWLSQFFSSKIYDKFHYKMLLWKGMNIYKGESFEKRWNEHEIFIDFARVHLIWESVQKAAVMKTTSTDKIALRISMLHCKWGKVAQRQISALKVGNVARQTRKLCARQQAGVAETLWTSSNLSTAWESLPAQPA